MKQWTGKRKILLAGSVVLVMLAVVTLLLFMNKKGSRKENGITQLQFSQGMTLSGYEIYDAAGKPLDISDISEKPTLVVFAMDGCRDCLADFPSYQILFSLFRTESFQVAFVWDDTVPQAELDKLNIPASASYSAKGRYKFTDWVPNYYFVDEADSITATTKEASALPSLLPEVEVTPEGFRQLTGGKPLLIGIDGCGACKEAAQRMDGEPEGYCYVLEGRAEKQEGDRENVLLDPHKLVSKAFGEEVFPVSVRLDEMGVLVVKEE